MRRDDLKRGRGISICKGCGAFGVGFLVVPLEFESLYHAIFLFQIINLLLLLGAPEPRLGKVALVSENLHAFCNIPTIQNYYVFFGIKSKNLIIFSEMG